MRKVSRIYILGVLCVLFFAQCNKNKNSDSSYADIPQVPVDLYLPLDQPAYFDLTVIGGWVYVEGGSRGILVYRNPEGYKAYERHTPYKSSESCAVVSVDDTRIYAVDGCSGSKFYLVDGTVAEGEAKLALKEYNVNEQQGILHIHN